jgi:hypothetical protein
MADETDRQPFLSKFDKLQIENEKLRKEKDKVGYEIDDLKRWRKKLWISFLSGAASALIAVMTFLIGQSATKSRDRIHEGDVLYQQPLTELGDKDPARRLSALTALKKFIQPLPREARFTRFLNYFSDDEVTEQAEAQRHDAIVLLVARLRNESDFGVIRQTLTTVQSSPELPIEDIADLNRAAAASFIQSAAQFSGLLVLATAKHGSMTQLEACQVPGLLVSIETEMQNLVLRSAIPSPRSGIPSSSFMIWPFLYSPFSASRFESEQRLALNDQYGQTIKVIIPGLHKLPTESEISSARTDFLQKALFLETTSILLASALDRKSDPLPLDLSYTAWVAGQLGSETRDSFGVASPKPAPMLKLSGVNLGGSYFGIRVFSTLFSGADLSNSDLREMAPGKDISFERSILIGAHIADDTETKRAFAAAHADLTGSGFLRPQLDKRIKSVPDDPPFCWGQ